MKTPLEDFVRANRPAFDKHKAPPDVWERIAADLPQQPSEQPSEQPSASRSTYRPIWFAAAAVIAMLVAFFLGQQSSTPEPLYLQNLHAHEAAYEASFKAHEAAFQEVVSELPNGKALSEKMGQNLSALFEEYERLEQELAVSPVPTRVVDAMIHNLEMRIQIMQEQVRWLKQLRKKLDQAQPLPSLQQKQAAPTAHVPA